MVSGDEKKALKYKPTKPIGPKESYTGKSIESFTFQGTKHQVRTWRQLLTIICATMAATQKDGFEEVLNLTGRKRPYFSKKPDQIRKPRKIDGTDIYVETNLSANSIVRMSTKVLSLFEYKPEDLSIEAK